MSYLIRLCKRSKYLSVGVHVMAKNEWLLLTVMVFFIILLQNPLLALGLAFTLCILIVLTQEAKE